MQLKTNRPCIEWCMNYFVWISFLDCTMNLFVWIDSYIVLWMFTVHSNNQFRLKKSYVHHCMNIIRTFYEQPRRRKLFCDSAVQREAKCTGCRRYWHPFLKVVFARFAFALESWKFNSWLVEPSATFKCKQIALKH